MRAPAVLFAIVMACAAAPSARAAEPAAPAVSAPAPAPAAPRAGDKAPVFALPAVASGETRALDAFTRAKDAKGKEKKGAVVVFLSCRCPYVVQARAPLAVLAKEYGEKLSFVGLNANQTEKVDEIKADASQSFPFPILRDEGAKVADLYGAERTPEVFVIDAGGVIRYHGGVADLGAALAQLVVGAPVGKPESKAFGCTIKRKS
jgi:peroxiredoxin